MRRGLWEVAADRRVLITSAMEAAQMTASGALMAFLPLYGLERGLSTGAIGLLFGAMGLASIAAKPLWGRVSDRGGRRGLIVLGQLICAAVMVLLPRSHDFVPLLVLALLFGFGEAVIGSSTSALVADLCRERNYGSAMGVFGTVMDIGHAAGPAVAGLLIGVWGYSGAFVAIGVWLVAITFAFIGSSGPRSPQARGQAA